MDPRFYPGLVVAASILIGVLAGQPSSAYPGAPWFKPSSVYTQNFPDPHVVVDGTRYIGRIRVQPTRSFHRRQQRAVGVQL